MRTAILFLCLFLLSGCQLEGLGENPVQSRFSKAVVSNDVAGVRRLIEQGADPNQTDSEGRTALGYAAYKGNDEMVRTLLEGGADVNSRDARGLTPVILAAAEGHESTLEILLKAGGDIRLGDKLERTPLWFASAEGNQERFPSL